MTPQTQASPLSGETLVQANPGQVTCDLGGESVVLDLNASLYYGLNAVGAVIWKKIQKPVRVGELEAEMLSEYDVSAAQCHEDLMRLLRMMLDKGLVTIIHEAAG